MAFKRLAAHSGCSKLCSPYVLYTGGEYNDENVSTGYSHSCYGSRDAGWDRRPTDDTTPAYDTNFPCCYYGQHAVSRQLSSAYMRHKELTSPLFLQTEKEVSVVDEELTVGDVMFALKVIPSNQIVIEICLSSLETTIRGTCAVDVGAKRRTDASAIHSRTVIASPGKSNAMEMRRRIQPRGDDECAGLPRIQVFHCYCLSGVYDRIERRSAKHPIGFISSRTTTGHKYAISVNRVLGIRAAPSLQAVPCPISAVAAQRPSYELHNYPANVKRLTVYDSSPFPWYQGFPNESTRITEAS
ncbi:hypothetical protein POSPLADRAFT_1141054 [Postia placenta MAD-698-R-SB12]|uniref:Uncharacterized protein n=1 Tax=Postia placenta MAD-698-R-SB12 TaxID=670580 RepID=A0A1X6N1S2_9APHY|nr:hypothetical protein POSPLADRAFT_1141054 [Postia placenta MAD-698-R-SB12]OSX62568.1 hypothetical protein POSPLADRAFT_1141054 [Postia placenta MAD-698-R-SB12]